MNTYNYIIDKYKIDVGRQHLIDVEGMIGSVDLSKLFAELNFNLGVEVGVDRGLFSEILCKDNPNLNLYGVDPWIREAFPEGNPYRLKQDYFDGCYEEAVERLAPYNVTIIKKTSMDALADFKDNSLDFVYIDANHDFLNFTLDLHHWIKKVRFGGIISGHDYAYYSYSKFNHVKRALIAYARCYRMIPLFAVMQTHEGLKRDKYRSWFWVKDKDCP
jgi:hypothetical protein